LQAAALSEAQAARAAQLDGMNQQAVMDAYVLDREARGDDASAATHAIMRDRLLSIDEARQASAERYRQSVQQPIGPPAYNPNQ
jgi:hypothetical protein